MNMRNHMASKGDREQDALSGASNVWPLRLGAVILAATGVFPLANYITTGQPMGWWPAALRLWMGWGIGVVIGVLVISAALPRAVDWSIAAVERVLLAPRRSVFASTLGVLACGLSLAFGWYLFRNEPIVGDEFVQRWQAHLLASGHLYARPESSPEFFSSVEALDSNGRWFSQFPMGGPAMLAIGVLVHAPWLVNPVFVAIAVMALYIMLSDIGDELTARGTALLFALCPFVLFMAGSEMNHVPSLAWTSVALVSLVRWYRAKNGSDARWAAAAIGGSLGLAATIRPFDASIVALVIGVLQISVVWKRRQLLPSLLFQCAAGAIPVALLLAANWATLGHPFAFGYDVLNGVEHRPGFHMTPLGFEHTPRRGLYNVSAYLLKLDFGLLAWPVPAMLLVVLALGLQRKAAVWDKVFLGISGLLLAGYTAYWSLSSYLGPRFLYTAAPFFLIYVGRLPGTLRSRFRQPLVRRGSLLLIPAWMLIAWTYPPQHDALIGVRQLAALYKSRAVAPAIRDAVAKAKLTHAVVFIPEGWHARLAARLRALTFRPLIAEEIVKQSDACFLEQTLNMAEMIPASNLADRVKLVVRNVRVDVATSKVPGQAPSDQLSFVPGRPLAPVCRSDAEQMNSFGASLAEMLPYQEFDRSGRLAGDIIYARDFGRRNEQLRSRFGDRTWYVAHVIRTSGGVSAVLDAYHP
ncbi:MAG: hypothetical protein JWM95_4370 [Gemmatimonadetes bacterium]|nr:hypothetical protein [Gemmatimonadota bacterium]